jgi:hypothetical protein
VRMLYYLFSQACVTQQPAPRPRPAQPELREYPIARRTRYGPTA